MADAFKFEAFHDNVRVLTFNLRRFLDKQPWDVSAATQMYLECTGPDNVDILPIVALPGAPGANWTVGIVKVTIGPGDVTSLIGTWQAGLTVWIASEQLTVESGIIEVFDRPGYTP